MPFHSEPIPLPPVFAGLPSRRDCEGSLSNDRFSDRIIRRLRIMPAFAPWCGSAEVLLSRLAIQDRFFLVPPFSCVS